MKLKTKLIIALLLVALLSTGTGLALAIHSTNQSFNTYLASYASNNITQWQQIIGLYYEEHKSLEELQDQVPNVSRMMGNRGGQRGFAFNEQVLVINNEGKVVLDTFGINAGQEADASLLKEAKPILVDGEIIGQISIKVIPPRGVVTLEEQFISSVYQGFIWGGIVAVFFAIILGYTLSNTLVRPIQALTRVVKEFSRGNWLNQTEIVSKDEIGTLAKTFNQMAQQLDRSMKLKNQLVADVSHELRTPITIIRGNLESIQAGVKEPTPQLILSMNDEVLRLSRLVSELQQLSLIDNKNLPLNKKKVDLVALIYKTYEIFLVEAQGRGVKLKYQFVRQPFFIDIDKDKITQVIINLLTNALRHSSPQEEIIIEISEVHGDSPMAEIKIFDQGSGISPEKLGNIFERFYRTDEARNREQGGMGLGLAISKGIIEAHGGQIFAEANQPKGSVFTVQIPLIIS